MTITSLDGYRWLKNDIIRGNFQPDEKLRMSLLTSRYALGVGPLREALSQLVAERLVTVVNQKGIGWRLCQSRSCSIFSTPAPIWKRCWSVWRLPAVAMNGRQTFSQKRICSVSWRPVTPVRKCLIVGSASSGVSYGNCGGLWFSLFAANA